MNRKAKETAIATFKKKAVGDVMDDYLKELKKKLRGN